jgi:hypothetical protein
VSGRDDLRAAATPSWFAGWEARPDFLAPIPEATLCTGLGTELVIITPTLEPTVAFSVGLGIGVLVMGALAIRLLRRFQHELRVVPQLPFAPTSPLHPEGPATVQHGKGSR